MPDFPSHLYHYTSLENLALILSSKTIRFKRLDRLIDPEEGSTADLPGIKGHIFCSCWTASAEESIPLWKLYAGDMAGCRIRLPVNPFDGELKTANSANVNTPGTHIKLRKPAVTNANGTDDDDKQLVDVILGPSKIEYTSDSKKLAPSVVTTKSDSHALFDARGIGLTKKLDWAFEKEWRYRIHTWPEGNEYGSSRTEDGSREAPFWGIWNQGPNGRWIDVSIREEALKDLEIMVAPKAGDAGFIVAKALAPSTTSVIRSRIRIR